jgi:hypothetical protein
LGGVALPLWCGILVAAALRSALPLRAKVIGPL